MGREPGQGLGSGLGQGLGAGQLQGLGLGSGHGQGSFDRVTVSERGAGETLRLLRCHEQVMTPLDNHDNNRLTLPTPCHHDNLAVVEVSRTADHDDPYNHLHSPRDTHSHHHDTTQHDTTRHDERIH